MSKLNPTGTALVYSTFLGGNLADYGGHGIAVDPSGNAYVAGNTGSVNFPTTPGAFQTTFGGGFYDAFVSKLNPTGTALVYSTYLGGSSTDYGYGGRIAVDASGNAFVTGDTASSNFPTTTGAIQTTFGGFYDAFMTELNPTGTGLVYSTYLGGTGFDVGQGMAVDTSGNAYVTGVTGSSRFPTTAGAFQTTFGGNYDAFVMKFAMGTASEIVLSASRRQRGGVVSVQLAWSGATSTKVDIYRDGVQIARSGTPVAIKTRSLSPGPIPTRYAKWAAPCPVRTK